MSSGCRSATNSTISDTRDSSDIQKDDKNIKRKKASFFFLLITIV